MFVIGYIVLSSKIVQTKMENFHPSELIHPMIFDTAKLSKIDNLFMMKRMNLSDVKHWIAHQKNHYKGIRIYQSTQV